jgi:nitrogen fixation/metabolism regulation signal transduction histidine kinase
VDEFSRFGKMPKINLEPTNIRSIIEEVVELYSNLKETEILTSFNGEMPDIDMDKKQIKMALINLIDNAIQAKTEKILLNAYYNSTLDLIRLQFHFRPYKNRGH